METTAKVRSVRATDEVFDRFKEFASSFPNQSEALSSLISSWEMQQAKAVITERATEISDYDTHLQALQSAFLHSLELNENAEARIRQGFQLMLDTKDRTIANLQDQIKRLEEAMQSAQDTASTAQETAAALQTKLDAEIAARKAAEVAATDKQKIIDSMTWQLSQVKEAAERISEAESKITTAQNEAQEASRRVKQLEMELARVQAESELTASKAAVEMEVAMLNVRQDGQDRIGQLMEENHRLIQELADFKSKVGSNQNDGSEIK